MKTSILSILKKSAPLLYRHPKGTYYGIKTVAGKKKVENLHTTDYRIAQQNLAEWLLKLSDESGPGDEKGNTTVRQLLAMFAEVRIGKSESTRITEKGLIRLFIDTFKLGLGVDMKVAKVELADLTVWLAAQTGLRHSSYNRRRLFINQLFRLATTQGIIKKSPFDKDALPAKGRQRIIRRVPTDAEFNALISEIRDPAWEKPNRREAGGQRPVHYPESADFAEYLGLAGVGQAEASALQWADVDFEKKAVHYTRVKTGRSFEHPIYEWLRPLLIRLQTGNAGRGGPVFKIKSVRKALGAAAKRLRMAHFTQRGLRAYLIGRLWKRRVDPKTIAKWQGHSDGGILIMRIYTEVFGSNDASYEAQQLALAEGKIIPFAV